MLMKQILCFIFLVISSITFTNQQALAKGDVHQFMKGWVKPVNGILTDEFGTRNGKHKGIDIGANEGEKVVAVDDGMVTKSYYSDSYGHVIFVQHPSKIETVYAHLSKRLVTEGEHVKKGQEIGIVGSTGISTGTHLHFEAHVGNWTFSKENAFDPLVAFAEYKETDMEVSKQAKVVVVKEGDTLWSISKQYDVSVEKIKRWNGLSSTTIYPNQEIMIYT